jgi:Ni/Co efflux regulator RcnB
MRSTRWMVASAVGIFMLTTNFALVQAQGNGHSKGHEKHGEDDDQDERYYKDHDRETMRGWYDEHANNLPPGLAKKDRLPPGLEKQLVRRGTLPPGLQERLQPCPEDLERRLPPPPPGCAHVLVGGHVVLLNRRTNVVVDLVHFEIR